LSDKDDARSSSPWTGDALKKCVEIRPFPTHAAMELRHGWGTQIRGGVDKEQLQIPRLRSE
jgi:hypothetical protein